MFPSNFVEEIPLNITTKAKVSSKEDLNSLAGETEVKTPTLPPKPGMTFFSVKFILLA